ncbi:hypothetical protein ES703_88588 [subsurface metagenome]
MAKIVDQIRATDPELWKEVRAASLLKGGLVHEWIIDWLRFAVDAEKKLGGNARTILYNHLHSSKRSTVSKDQRALL